MSSIEERLTLLAEKYGRHLYISTTGTHRFGFTARGYSTKDMYETLEEAIVAEAKAVRQIMVGEQEKIAQLNHRINERLTHLGILEIE